MTTVANDRIEKEDPAPRPSRPRRFEAIDRRFDELEERLGNKIDMPIEHFEEVVNGRPRVSVVSCRVSSVSSRI